MTEKTEALIAEARREESIHDKLGDGFSEGSEERAFYYEHRDRYKRLADALEAATEVHDPKNLSIMNGWLVECVGEHTCGTGPDGYYGAHEPGCGYEPLVNLAELDGWPEAERDAALAAIERVRAIHERDMVLRDYCSECSDFGSDLFPPGQMVEWPCLTIRAIEDALGGEGDEYR